MKRRFLSVFIAVATLVPAISLAQGVQTGTLTGVVTSTDGVAVTEAQVVVTSSALQGERASRPTSTALMGRVCRLHYSSRSRKAAEPCRTTRPRTSGATASADATSRWLQFRVSSWRP